MSVANGEDADDTNFNAAFMSREIDTSTVGKVDLNEASSTFITDLQGTLNTEFAETDSLRTLSGTSEGDDDNGTFTGTTITDNVTSKVALQELETAVETKVTAPSSTDNAAARFDGTGGALQDSGVIIDDSDNVTGVNDLTVDGDLTVNGATTTVNTATLDVEDANITVNKNGTEATADAADAGLTVEMSDATDALIGFDSTLTSKFKAGEVGSELEIVTVSAAQLITAKDIDGLTASDTNRITLPKDTTANLAALTDKEATLWYDTSLNVPVFNDGSDNIPLLTSASGGASQTVRLMDNVGLAAAASVGALTIDLKQKDGSTDPAAAPASVKISHLINTLTTGGFAVIEQAAALSIVIPSGATLGYSDGDDAKVYVYSLNNAGALELAVSASQHFREDELHTTTAITTGSDANNVLYSTTLRSNITVRCLGYLQVDAITTAGTWTAPDTLRVGFFKEPSVVYLKDLKASNTQGGTFTSGSYQTRVLNTIEGDEEIVSLATNQWTLQPGLYLIDARAPGLLVDGHATKIRNITDSTDAIIGAQIASGAGDVTGSVSHCIGVIEITAAKTFELQHRATTTRATNGFGNAANFGVSEVYAQVKITKVR